MEKGEQREDIYDVWKQSVSECRIGEAEDLIARTAFLASNQSVCMTEIRI